MNDFTKDELIDLHYYTRRWHEYNNFDEGEAKLIDKLASMIENYIEPTDEQCRHGITERNCFTCVTNKGGKCYF